MFLNHNSNNVISPYQSEDEHVILPLRTAQLLSRRTMKAAAASHTSKRTWDEPSFNSLPGSCYLDECPHFIRYTDTESMKENCNKHLKEIQESRQIDLDLFQRNCPVDHNDTWSHQVEPVEQNMNFYTIIQDIFLHMLLKCEFDLLRQQ